MLLLKFLRQFGIGSYFRKYRYTAYRQLVRWCFGVLGRQVRVPLPACAVRAIRAHFPSDCDSFRGFRYPELWLSHSCFVISSVLTIKMQKFTLQTKPIFSNPYKISWPFIHFDSQTTSVVVPKYTQSLCVLAFTSHPLFSAQLEITSYNCFQALFCIIKYLHHLNVDDSVQAAFYRVKPAIFCAVARAVTPSIPSNDQAPFQMRQFNKHIFLLSFPLIEHNWL